MACNALTLAHHGRRGASTPSGPFIVPFMFVYEPALLMIGDWGTIVWRAAVSALGVLVLAAGLHGYLLRRARLWERAVLIAAAFCLVKPGLATDLIGAALLALVVVSQFATRDRDTHALPDLVPAHPRAKSPEAS